MKILMATIGYPPKYVGGTEVYVLGLVEALKQRGHPCAVAYIEPFEEAGAPEVTIATSQSVGTAIYVIRVNTIYHKLEFIVFDAVLRQKLLDAYRQVLADFHPDIVHFHPLQLGFESYLIEMLHQAGNKVVMTYHTPTTSCARGDLIYLGREVCDSLLLQERCTRCYYHRKSLPEAMAEGLSNVPLTWYRPVFEGIKQYPILQKLRSFASIPFLIEERIKAWIRATENADVIIAVSQWVKNTLLVNGVPEEKILVSRHGLHSIPFVPAKIERDVIRFGYFGRISPEKGIDCLLTALKMIPREVNYKFEFYGAAFNKLSRDLDEKRLVEAIFKLQASDSRVQVLAQSENDNFAAIFANWDAMVVPSLWLESGPQVVYEAFAVKTPIIGSRRGGIAELVNEGKTGLLFSPGNSEELASLLQRCAENPAELRALRDNILPVRTTGQVADDMLKVYGRLTAYSAAS